MMMLPSTFRADSTRSAHSTSPHTSRRSSRSAPNVAEIRARSAPLFTKQNQRLSSSEETIDFNLEEEKAVATSAPVAIPMIRPMRPHVAAQTIRSAGRPEPRSTRSASSTPHDHGSLPPAVAALLAMTAIPTPPRRRDRKKLASASTRRISIDELVQEWKRDISPAPSSLICRSPLDILLETASDEEDMDCDTVNTPPSSEKETEYFEGLSIARSASSMSLMSTPSLDAANSTWSSWTPRTPSIVSRRPMQEKRDKLLALSPPKEQCHDDHPLLTPLESTTSADDLFAPTPTPAAPRGRSMTKATKPKASTLKSNLTASFAALKSAAKTLSNFAASSIPSDDLLTQSIMGPGFAPEMRPNFQGTPDPALRRYFNPSPYGGIDSQFSAQLRNALGSPIPVQETKESVTAARMIPLQTYRRSARRSPSRSPPANAKSTGLEAGPLVLANGVALRQREPRENSAFLRVIVLEMNMRRSGKLDNKSAGRARVWLPPRKNEPLHKGLGKRRWIAVGPDGQDMD